MTDEQQKTLTHAEAAVRKIKTSTEDESSIAVAVDAILKCMKATMNA